MNERRKGQHSAVHRLKQVKLDLVQAYNSVQELDEKSNHKFNALCYINESLKVITRIVDEDLGPKLIEDNI